MKFHFRKKKSAPLPEDESRVRRLRMTHMLVSAIGESDDWARACREDPEIQEAEHDLSNLLERLRSMVPAELYHELNDAITHAIASYENAAILYGMRMRQTMDEPMCSPAEHTRYWRTLYGD